MVERNIMGVGPKLALWALPVLVLGIAATIAFREASRIPLPAPLEVGLAALLLAAGLALYASAGSLLVRDFKKGQLITTGAYAWSQNPLYASFIFFLVPALALFFDAWPLLFTSLALYVAHKRFIGAEYRELEAAFGDEHGDYHATTSELFPVPPPAGRHAHA